MNSSQVKDEFLHMDERISSIYDGEYFRVMQRKGDILIVNSVILFCLFERKNVNVYKLHRYNASLVGQMPHN